MNKLVLATLAVIALGASLSHGFVFGSSGLSSGFSEYLYGNDKSRSAGLFSLSGANRFRDSAAAKLYSGDRASLFATNKDGAALSIRNKQAGEEYLNAKDTEELAADNFLSTANRFAMSIVDENAHDEGSSIKYRKGSEIDTASRFAIDQAVDAENFNENAVEAAAESVDEKAANRDVEEENLLDKKEEVVLEQETEIEHQIAAEEGK